MTWMKNLLIGAAGVLVIAGISNPRVTKFSPPGRQVASIWPMLSGGATGQFR